MKFFLSTIALFVCLLFSFQQAITMIFFKLNQKAVEENFCINKTSPQRQCHGNCYLKKELQETESNAKAHLSLVKNIDVALAPLPELEIKTSKKIQCKKIFFYKEKYYNEPYIEIFVPPPIT